MSQVPSAPNLSPNLKPPADAASWRTPPGLTHAAIDVRPLHTMAECNACVELQRHVWGFGQADMVPSTLLHVMDYVGGIALGAFDEKNTLLGFVFGVTGVRDGQSVHWSHMLGVEESARNIGVGRLLKERQRDALALLGVQRIFWSFDPLMSKNAHFNINALGASIVEYVPNMYGKTSSPLHLGLPTDRIVVAIGTKAGDVHPAPPVDDVLPILTMFPQPHDVTIALGPARPPVVLIEMPPDILAMTAEAPQTARIWRLAVRDHFQWVLANGYRAIGVRREAGTGRFFYVMAL